MPGRVLRSSLRVQPLGLRESQSLQPSKDHCLLLGETNPWEGSPLSPGHKELDHGGPRCLAKCPANRYTCSGPAQDRATASSFRVHPWPERRDADREPREWLTAIPDRKSCVGLRRVKGNTEKLFEGVYKFAAGEPGMEMGSGISTDVSFLSLEMAFTAQQKYLPGLEREMVPGRLARVARRGWKLSRPLRKVSPDLSRGQIGMEERRRHSEEKGFFVHGRCSNLESTRWGGLWTVSE